MFVTGIEEKIGLSLVSDWGDWGIPVVGSDKRTVKNLACFCSCVCGRALYRYALATETGPYSVTRPKRTSVENALRVPEQK